MPFAIYLLALAVFAMGTSEFLLAGLVPEIALDLDVSLAAAGLLTSAFAVGMIVGAPLMAALSRFWPRRASLLLFLAVFVAVHVVGALTDSFAVLFATRVLAAIANAGFLAVALTTATNLVTPDRKGRALAVLLSGTTVACIVGVPGGALLGTVLDWRAAFWAVAVLCLPAALGVLRGVEAAPREQSRVGLRNELAQLRRPRLLVVLTLGAVVNAATFGSFTYLSPLVTDVSGLRSWWIPVVLATFGLGSFVGVSAAGRLADQHAGKVVAVGGTLLLAGWVTLGLGAHLPVALIALAFTQGALSFAVGSTLITGILYEAAQAPMMAGSYATAALNVGAAAGPAIAGLALSSRGLIGPVWISAALIAVALLLALPAHRVVARTASVPPLHDEGP